MEPNLPPLPGSAPSDLDRALAVLCHLSLMLGVGFVLPLVVYLIRNQSAPWLGVHARETLNFHVTLIVYGIICAILILFVVGIPLLIGLGIFSVVCAIIGAMRASQNEYYQYPITIRLF